MLKTNLVNCEFYETGNRRSEKIMICFGQIRQTNKSLTYCIYKMIILRKYITEFRAPTEAY